MVDVAARVESTEIQLLDALEHKDTETMKNFIRNEPRLLNVNLLAEVLFSVQFTASLKSLRIDDFSYITKGICNSDCCFLICY